MALSIPAVLTAWGLVSLAASVVAGSWLARLDRHDVLPAMAEEPESIEGRVAA